MAYQGLKDSNIIGTVTSARVFTKFCTLGTVSSRKWSDTFVCIQDGFLRLYDSEETYRTNPANYVLEIFLDSKHQTSEIKSKDYSKNSFNQAIIHYTYLQIDNGIWAEYRLLKIGSTDIDALVNLRTVSYTHLTLPTNREV